MRSKSPQCPVQLTANIVGGRWKTVILWHLLQRTHRFAELQRRVIGISQKVLIQQLRELERDGLLTRTVHPEVPPRVEYSLTPDGESLRPVILAMCAWGKAKQAGAEGPALPKGKQTRGVKEQGKC